MLRSDEGRFMAFEFTCGAPNETKPGYCGRGVREWDMRCCCHRDGSCGHRGTATNDGDGPHEPAPPPAPLPPRPPRGRPQTYYQPSDHQVEVTVDVIEKILTDGWKAAVEGQLATVLNDEFWKSVPR